MSTRSAGFIPRDETAIVEKRAEVRDASALQRGCGCGRPGTSLRWRSRLTEASRESRWEEGSRGASGPARRGGVVRRSPAWKQRMVTFTLSIETTSHSTPPSAVRPGGKAKSAAPPFFASQERAESQSPFLTTKACSCAAVSFGIRAFSVASWSVLPRGTKRNMTPRASTMPAARANHAGVEASPRLDGDDFRGCENGLPQVRRRLDRAHGGAHFVVEVLLFREPLGEFGVRFHEDKRLLQKGVAFRCVSPAPCAEDCFGLLVVHGSNSYMRGFGGLVYSLWGGDSRKRSLRLSLARDNPDMTVPIGNSSTSAMTL